MPDSIQWALPEQQLMSNKQIYVIGAKGLHGGVSQSMEKHLIEKFGFLEKLVKPNSVISMKINKENEQFFLLVECKLSNGEKLFAEGRAETFEESVQVTRKKVKHQVSQKKGKKVQLKKKEYHLERKEFLNKASEMPEELELCTD